MSSATVLPKRDFERYLESVIATSYKDAPWLKGKTGLERRRALVNAAICLKVYQAADYGPLMDVRQLIALRIAPWLKPNAHA